MFKIMTGVLDLKKRPEDHEKEKIAPFVFCRWLSGSRDTIFDANKLNLYYNIPIISQYDLIKAKYAGKIGYIPYPKNVWNDSSKNVEFLSKHFKISEEKAKEYLDYISDEELKEIVDMYTELELR